MKGVRFQGLRDAGDPVSLASAYTSAGADELAFLDVTATLKGRGTLKQLVERVAGVVSIPFTVGGGLRTVAGALALLDAGADKVVLNTAAIERPALLEEIAAVVGSQAVVCAIDTKGGRVFSHAGRRDSGLGTVQWATEAEKWGAGEILLTSIDADGTRSGYDLDITRQVAEAVAVPVIASGGAGTAAHVADALEVAEAALLASILHEDAGRLVTLREELRAKGVPLRDVS